MSAACSTASGRPIRSRSPAPSSCSPSSRWRQGTFRLGAPPASVLLLRSDTNSFKLRTENLVLKRISSKFTVLSFEFSVSPQSQIEASGDPEFGRRRVRQDFRDAVIAQPRGSAEDERVAGLQGDGIDGIAAPQAAEEKSRCVPERHGYDRVSGGKRCLALILVLMKPHAAVGVVVVEDTDVGVE